MQLIYFGGGRTSAELSSVLETYEAGLGYFSTRCMKGLEQVEILVFVAYEN